MQSLHLQPTPVIACWLDPINVRADDLSKEHICARHPADMRISSEAETLYYSLVHTICVIKAWKSTFPTYSQCGHETVMAFSVKRQDVPTCLARPAVAFGALTESHIASRAASS